MEIRPRHWLVALVLAGLCHAALVMAFTPRQTALTLAVPITIELGPPGGSGRGAAGGGPSPTEVAASVAAPAEAATVLEPLAPEPIVETLETVAAQEVEPPAPTVARTLPRSDPKPKPKPQPVKKTTPKPSTQAGAEVPSRRSAPAASAGDGQTGRGGSGARGGQGAGGDSGSAATGNYYGRLAAWLNRHKRYPSHARRRHQEGTVKVVFTIDRRGHLVSHRILESSGHPLLDEEVEALLRRAAPLPAIPPEMRQAQLTVTVPIDFRLR
jgi:protein TonB